MKKALAIIGGIVVAILLVAAIAAAIYLPKVLSLNRDATAYLEEAIPQITNGWNCQNLIDRASPHMAAEMIPRAKVEELFTMFQRLGPLKHMDAPTGSIGYSAFSGEGAVTYGEYTTHALFEKGPATIKIQILRLNNTWKINGLHIDSALFLSPIN